MVNIRPPVALLGFTNNEYFDGDLYDRQKQNWEINGKWKLNKMYNTIICTRCAYFSKDPEDFIKRCRENLNSGGRLYVDWGIGDHWRFQNFKVGWVKDGEHEFAYGSDNLLWSGVWDDSILDHVECKKFQNEIQKKGYGRDLKKYIYDEIPHVIELSSINRYFRTEYSVLTLTNPLPLTMYVLIKGEKIEK